MQDRIFKVLLILSALVIPVIGGGIIYSLFVDASGAFQRFGFWLFLFNFFSGVTIIYKGLVSKKPLNVLI